MKRYIPILFAQLFAFASILSGCGGKSHRHDDAIDSVSDTDSIPTVMPDTLTVPKDSIVENKFDIDSSDEALSVLRELPDANLYMHGVLPSMAKFAPEYLKKILNSTFSKFIVVDKARMKVILYDRYGNVIKSYGMACSRKYGTKHKKADNRTPEGFFSVEGIYDSTDWLFTDDDGKTSKKKGQFGPRFIRLAIPNTTQIGIHGTCAPWSIGGRSSHGCIRVTNENILELVDLVEIGMPVIVIPGKKDRSVNREEGYDIAYFPTAPGYAVKPSELVAASSKPDSVPTSSDAAEAPVDSVTVIPETPSVIPDAAPEPMPKDSI